MLLSGTLTICLGETDFPITGENRIVLEGPSVWELRALGESPAVLQAISQDRLEAGAERDCPRRGGGGLSWIRRSGALGPLPWRTGIQGCTPWQLPGAQLVRVAGVLQSQVGILLIFKKSLKSLN